MFHKCFHKNIILTSFSSRFYCHRPSDLSYLKPNLDRKPEAFQLEHIEKRLSYTAPYMFKTKLDFTFYHKSVILDDKILNVKRYGLQSFMSYISIISVIGQVLFPHIHTEVIKIVSIPSDGTVELRWRICYISWLSLLFNYKLFRFDYRMKNVRIFLFIFILKKNIIFFS